ncbi:MAG: site-specific DNA-methyltransferase [Vicinamibacterales bacterium]
MLPKNRLYYGDNLDVLRRYVPDESVDLVYLDPPFNSNANYNVLFAEKSGTRAAAQIKAFEDTWQWDESAAAAYRDVVEAGGSVAQALIAFRTFLGDSDMLAYLAMMAPRLVELRRVLKPTGSIYLHCDPTASHYLKMLLDAVFGPAMFRNEIVWQRTGAHGSSKRFGPIHDTVFFYTKSDTYVWNPAYLPLPQETADEWFNNIDPETGRRFNRNTLTAPGVRSGASGKPWRGIDPTAKGRHWAVPGFARDVIGDLDTLEALDELDKMGRVFWPKKPGGTPMLKLYLDESNTTLSPS